MPYSDADPPPGPFDHREPKHKPLIIRIFNPLRRWRRHPVVLRPQPRPFDQDARPPRGLP